MGCMAVVEGESRAPRGSAVAPRLHTPRENSCVKNSVNSPTTMHEPHVAPMHEVTDRHWMIRAYAHPILWSCGRK